MGWRAEKFRLPYQREGYQVLHRASRERPSPHDRPLSNPLARGRSRHRQTRPRREDARKVRPNTTGYANAVDEFIERSAEKNRPGTVSEYKRLLTSHFPFGTTRLHDITSEQIEKRLKPLGDRPSEQQHAFTAINVFFNWAQKRRYVQSNPCVALFSPSKSESRTRVLTDSELRTVLKQARAETGAYGKIVELLILTGQRRGEIAALEWKWIDEKEVHHHASLFDHQEQARACLPLRPHGRRRLEDNSSPAASISFPRARSVERGSP